MKKIILLLSILFVFQANAQQTSIDPALYQTWYLYSTSVDLGDTNYYYGEDVARMTIFEDLTFYATDNCWELTGNFEEDIPFSGGDFGLNTINYEKECVLGGSSGYVLELLYEFNQTMGCYLDASGAENWLSMETYAGFVHTFKNEITLSAPENSIEAIKIYPNPTSEILNISNLSTPIDSVDLIAMNGKIVKSYSTVGNQLNISEVPTGIYFLRITQDGATTVKRIVKE